MTGRVKFINEEKGFGFIKSKESTKDIFVHSSGLIDEISERDYVEFDVSETAKGLSAINVKVLETSDN
jgi:CspA family cold shock protein